MPDGPDDLTPPEGTPIPEETPTEPEIGVLPCPACGEAGRTLRVNPDGLGARVMRCDLCEGLGRVSKAKYEGWIKKHGRKP